MAIPEAVQRAIDKQLAEANKEESKPEPKPIVDQPQPIKTDPDPENETPVAKAIDQPKAPPKVKEFIEPPKPPSDEKLECVREIGEILGLHSNQESNIPHGHKYWTLLNEYRSL